MLPILIAILFVGASILFANYAIANVTSIDVGLGPRDASINHITNKVYVSNQFDDTVSVIDGATDTVIKTISVTKPGKSAVNTDTNLIYVISDNDVVVIDGATDTVIKKIFFVGIAPNSVAIDLDTNKIYVSARISNHVAVIDGNTNTKLTPIAVGDTPVSVVFNPDTNLLYVALNADLAVDVIDVSTDMVINTIPIDQVGTVGHGPFELILNAKDDVLYVSNCHIGRFPGIVSVVDIKPGSPDENSIIDNIAVEAPGDGSFDPDTDMLYVATQEGNAVAVIDTKINEIVAELPGGEMTIGATLNQVSKKLYALNYKTTLDFPQTAPTEIGTITILDVTNVPPSADAGADQTVNEATLVTLNGGQSSDSNLDPLTFSWTQISGPAVTLTGADTANPTFTAPNVDPQEVLTFELTVSDGIFEVKDRVNVLVRDVKSFAVPLAPTADGVAGNVDVGDVEAGDQIALQYQTPAGILPNAELQQELITSGVAGNDVSFNFDIRSDVPAGLPPLPVSSALFFDINVENLDLGDPANFPADQLPITKFLVNKDFPSNEHFEDGCPVIFLYLFNDVTGQWKQQGDPLKPNTNKIYVANFRSDTVSVIDGSLNSVSATINVGSGPFEVAYNDVTNMVYVTNQDSGTVSVIDATSNAVVATINVGDDPIAISVNSATNTIYVANQGSNTITVIDGSTNTIVSSMDVGTSPVGFGINQNTNKIYVANQRSDSVSVIDGSTNTVEKTISGGGTGGGMGTGGGGGMGMGALHIGDAPSAIGVNPNTNKIYVANRGSDTISVIDGAKNKVEAAISVGNFPISVTVDPTTNLVFVYVANLFSDSVSVIDGLQGSPTENKLLANIDVGDAPSALGINPNTKRIYVTNNQDDSISVIDGLTNTVLDTIAVGKSPVGLAVNPSVPNPVRDPSSDVLAAGTGEILQCAYFAEKPHFSKYGIGAQPTGGAGGGVTIGGGSSGGRDRMGPVAGSSTLMVSGSPEDGFGGTIVENDLNEESTTRVIDVGEKLTLRFEVFENRGVSKIDHVSLYLNGKGHYNLLDGDTYIRYNQYKDLEIKDHHGLFSKVDFKINVIDTRNVVLIFEITFDKPMNTSDLLLRMWDSIKNQQDLEFVDAIQVVQSESKTIVTPTLDDGPWSKSVESSLTKSTTIFNPEFNGNDASFDVESQQTVSKIQKIPIWVKNNANWWSQQEINDDDFVAGIHYLIERNIIQVPDRHIVSILETLPSPEIPAWVKTNAAWWADDLITDEEFMLSIQWLIKEGIMMV